MVSYYSQLASKRALGFGPLTLKNLLNYSPNLAVWGGASAAAILVFTESWPTFQDLLFKRIPYFGSHWVKEIPPEDSPQ
ncbi:HGL050Cp [Eremothecium sinecaudum]|uniref:HGL050Cp n=1 Tax=Eremothecium sinecaudum TaxID=45286 RepID=A0A109V014_9SACH|nr:HGL050Cp [Eremothecium sinecaudum]AMD22290.1 HGL050Cp [Eremothecium sinecaudum]